VWGQSPARALKTLETQGVRGAAHHASVLTRGDLPALINTETAIVSKPIHSGNPVLITYRMYYRAFKYSIELILAWNFTDSPHSER
jgi:hypothetical protein